MNSHVQAKALLMIKTSLVSVVQKKTLMFIRLIMRKLALFSNITIIIWLLSWYKSLNINILPLSVCMKQLRMYSIQWRIYVAADAISFCGSTSKFYRINTKISCSCKKCVNYNEIEKETERPLIRTKQGQGTCWERSEFNLLISKSAWWLLLFPWLQKKRPLKK